MKNRKTKLSQVLSALTVNDDAAALKLLESVNAERKASQMKKLILEYNHANIDKESIYYKCDGILYQFKEKWKGVFHFSIANDNTEVPFEHIKMIDAPKSNTDLDQRFNNFLANLGGVK